MTFSNAQEHVNTGQWTN